MITVKLTPIGGYICGDGNIPGGLDPDQFMKLFMARIIQAKAAGLTEFGLTDEEIETVIVDQTEFCNNMMDNAPVHRFNDNASPQQLLEAM